MHINFNLFCLPESFNTNISHQLFDYTIHGMTYGGPFIQNQTDDSIYLPLIIV